MVTENNSSNSSNHSSTTDETIGWRWLPWALGAIAVIAVIWLLAVGKAWDTERVTFMEEQERLNTDIASLRDNLLASEQAREAAQKVYSTTQLNLKQTTAEGAAAGKETDDVNAELQAMREEVQKMEKEIAARQEYLTALEQEVQSYTAERQKLQEEMSEVEERRLRSREGVMTAAKTLEKRAG